jgi:hypothetical protein
MGLVVGTADLVTVHLEYFFLKPIVKIDSRRCFLLAIKTEQGINTLDLEGADHHAFALPLPETLRVTVVPDNRLTQ